MKRSSMVQSFLSVGRSNMLSRSRTFDNLLPIILETCPGKGCFRLDLGNRQEEIFSSFLQMWPYGENIMSPASDGGSHRLGSCRAIQARISEEEPMFERDWNDLDEGRWYGRQAAADTTVVYEHDRHLWDTATWVVQAIRDRLVAGDPDE
jgi:hypothetical protein